MEPLLPRDGEDVLQLSMLAVPVAVATTTGEELQPSLTAQQVGVEGAARDRRRRKSLKTKGRRW